ncbi:MAG TPA: hypothetical protein VIJ14_06840 [Rhabdochlamydiaceae bacterium]
MTEIALPWHPESEKPTLPSVICTNGDGHYWIGSYSTANRRWRYSVPTPPHLTEDYGLSPQDCYPLAWCDPREFVPFEKKRKSHHHKNDDWEITEPADGILVLENLSSRAYITCNFCLFCGYKAEGK